MDTVTILFMGFIVGCLFGCSVCSVAMIHYFGNITVEVKVMDGRDNTPVFDTRLQVNEK